MVTWIHAYRSTRSQLAQPSSEVLECFLARNTSQRQLECHRANIEPFTHSMRKNPNKMPHELWDFFSPAPVGHVAGEWSEHPMFGVGPIVRWSSRCRCRSLLGADRTVWSPAPSATSVGLILRLEGSKLEESSIKFSYGWAQNLEKLR